MSKIKETSTNYENKKTLIAECDEVYAANLISGQWTLAIACYLAPGKLRFGELKKEMQYITERMLTLHLRKMEKNGLVSRKVYAEVPPRVEYELTAIGLDLIPVIKQLENWGRKHREITKDTGN
jgi:DNA-binding HxlR family transcriptional regulator